MQLLQRILYAAHASGTHHKIALRSLTYLQTPEAEAWRRLFLQHAADFMEGAKAPDTTFKDFQNHVLHCPGGEAAGFEGAEWGGAPTAATAWFEALVRALRRRVWGDAAYAAGVLSHYYSDPLMPLHTGSSDAETKAHRAVEWSASKVFEDLWLEVEPGIEALEIGPAGTETPAAEWVAAMVRFGAAQSAVQYWPLLDGYDLERGVKTPEEGLSPEARTALAALIGVATLGTARLIDRAIAEAGATPAPAPLTAATVVAGLTMPLGWVLKKIDDAGARAEVRRIHAELTATGAIVDALPEEQRRVRAGARAAGADGEPPRRRRTAAGATRAETPTTSQAPKTSQAPRPTEAPRSETAPAPADAPRRRPALTADAPVEAAPSVGPKTAARLADLGVRTVGDLAEADPDAVAAGLADSRMPAAEVAIWRDQARLLLALPSLKASHAVLLVAAGVRDVAQLAASEKGALQDSLAEACAAPRVQRALRAPKPPAASAVRRMIDAAQAAMAAKVKAA